MKQNISNLCDYDITKASNQQLSRNIIPCAKCGSKERKLGIGKGPHLASLRCGKCDHFIKWLGKSELAKIENQGGLR
jgi:hypothetical protein